MIVEKALSRQIALYIILNNFTMFRIKEMVDM